MTKPDRVKILFVDDEPNVVSGIARQLHAQYDIISASSGSAGLELYQKNGPFQIVVSDLRMPHMDGVSFLGKIRELNSDTIRILLTGQADLNSAISAVNEGYIFRFLTKPCPVENMLQSLKSAEDQYNLITAEKILLEQTLQGSIKTLVDILSLVNPTIFSMVSRVKSNLSQFLEVLEIQEKWPIQVAAMLFQIGTITLPDDIINKLQNNQALKPEEEEMLGRVPSIGEKLLSHIPRLEKVREILHYQEKNYDGSGTPTDNLKHENIPLGARILKILIDYDKLQAKDFDSNYIFDTMLGREGHYDEKLLSKFASLFGKAKKKNDIREISIHNLECGMILADDLLSTNGLLLLSRGIEVSPAHLERLQNIYRRGGFDDQIRIVIPS